MSTAFDEWADDYGFYAELVAIHQYAAVSAEAAWVAAVKACIDIVEQHQVPVGNSAAGEIACEMTMDSLKDVRGQMKALITCDLK